MLVGLFLIAGDQGGFKQKNRVSSVFYLYGVCSPREEEVLHDGQDTITHEARAQAA